MLRGSALGTCGPGMVWGAGGAAPSQGPLLFIDARSWQVFYSQTWRRNKASPAPHPSPGPKGREGTRMSDERQEAGGSTGSSYPPGGSREGAEAGSVREEGKVN